VIDQPSSGPKRKLRIAMVLGLFPKLSETFVIEQIVSLLDAGHDVRIFALGDPKEKLHHPEVDEWKLLERTVYLPRKKGLVQKLRALSQVPRFGGEALELTRELEARRQLGSAGSFDAILCHFGHVGEEGRKLRRAGFFDGPLAVIFHAADVTTWLAEHGDQAYERLFAEAALLLPISQHWQKKLTRLGAAPEKLHVVHMGVDLRALEYRARTLGEGEPLQLLSVARLMEKKGIAYAIEALALARDRLGRSFEYHIVGDGPLRGELEALVKTHGLTQEVVFDGWRTTEQVAAMLERAHVLLAPSVTAKNGDMEGIPVALMEAMAQGLPVLSTDHSGIPELVKNGDTGYTVPERDAPALADALVRLVSEHAEWPELTQRARAMVEREFDSAKLTRELEGLLLELPAV
jgi:colanic acid/amylovoran biosynthesis glycosyltransferase